MRSAALAAALGTWTWARSGGCSRSASRSRRRPTTAATTGSAPAAPAFGHSGFHPGGIRVGGESRNRSAVKVAGERRYRGYRADTVVGSRQFEVALRRLRRLSSRDETPPDELDLDATIQATADHAGALSLQWRRSRRNQTRVLLLMDAGGSMHAHLRICSQLFTAVNRATHFKDLRLYYFHNCVYDHLYLDPTCHPRNSVLTARVMQELSSVQARPGGRRVDGAQRALG